MPDGARLQCGAIYKLDLRADFAPMHEDGIAKLKAAYLEDGHAPSNTA